jgi:predicted DNA-binding transcriptional regulator AlpA
MNKEQSNLKPIHDILMTPLQVARYTGLSVRTLANKRSLGSGPTYCKAGKITYWKSDVDAWLDQHRAKSSNQLRVQRALNSVACKSDELESRKGLGEMTRVADAPFSEMKATLSRLHPTEASWALQNLLRCEGVVRRLIRQYRAP